MRISNFLLSKIILGFMLILITLLWISKAEQHEEKRLQGKASVPYDMMGDNFSEHLNALTERLRTVMDDHQKMKESQQQLLWNLQESKKSMSGLVWESELKKLAGLFSRIEKLEQDFKALEYNRNISPIIQAEAQALVLSSESFEIVQDLSAGGEAKLMPPEAAVLAYTLPSGATLALATTMSALIGRIPVEGSIKSPYPFKIILGQENLAANGLVLPEVNGAIVQGYSVGDMTLQCVRGIVTELTFLFPDGTIVNNRSQSSAVEALDQSLGYLSEPDGNPCIAGAFYSNVGSFLAGEVGLSTLAGAAKGLQLAQQGSQLNAYGQEQHYFNGHLGQLMAGAAGEEGATRVQAWWEARQKDSFDAIYVPSGHPVTINITQNIQIDYHPQARKLRYEYKTAN